MNNNQSVHSRARGNPVNYRAIFVWIPVFTGMFLLAGMTVHAAAGVCVVCPPGHDCSSGEPVRLTDDGALVTRAEMEAFIQQHAVCQ